MPSLPPKVRDIDPQLSLHQGQYWWCSPSVRPTSHISSLAYEHGAKVLKKEPIHPDSPKYFCNYLIFSNRYLMAQKVMKSGGNKLKGSTHRALP
jgi:hypothetical protein